MFLSMKRGSFLCGSTNVFLRPLPGPCTREQCGRQRGGGCAVLGITGDKRHRGEPQSLQYAGRFGSPQRLFLPELSNKGASPAGLIRLHSPRAALL